MAKPVPYTDKCINENPNVLPIVPKKMRFKDKLKAIDRLKQLTYEELLEGLPAYYKLQKIKDFYVIVEVDCSDVFQRYVC